MRKREDNVQFVTRLMEFSKSGALMQLMVIDALDKLSRNITRLTPQEVAEAFGKNPLADPMVNPVAWHACAKELRAELDKRLQR